MISDRYEDGKRIISVDTAEEFGQVLHETDNYRVEIEAPKKIIDAFTYKEPFCKMLVIVNLLGDSTSGETRL